MTESWVNPIGKGLKPARIDMGVDYTGSGPLYAMGAGTITNVYNTGWPGGKFIGLKLDSGQYMYYAENINPSVSVGDRVQAGQKIGQAVGTYPYIEVGWAAPPGTGNAMAATAGQASASGDPGSKSTAYGVSMSNTIASLGGPAGILTPGGIVGQVGSGYPSGSSVDSSGSGTSTSGASLGNIGCVPLIWVVWVIWNAICHQVERRRNLSSGKRDHWAQACEADDQRESGGTSAIPTRCGIGDHTPPV